MIKNRMKNFINTARKTGPLRTKDSYNITASMVDANGELSIWNLMQILNEVKGRRMEQLLLNASFKEKFEQLDVKMYSAAELNEDLEFLQSKRSNHRQHHRALHCPYHQHVIAYRLERRLEF